MVIICACALQRPATELNKIYSQGFSSGTGRSICTYVAFLQPNGTKFLNVASCYIIGLTSYMYYDSFCYVGAGGVTFSFLSFFLTDRLIAWYLSLLMFCIGVVNIFIYRVLFIDARKSQYYKKQVFGHPCPFKFCH